MFRWIHPEKERYYLAGLEQDLLGDWTLVLCWGGKESRRGRTRLIYVPSQDAGLKRLTAIARRRAQRGYRLDTDSDRADA